MADEMEMTLEPQAAFQRILDALTQEFHCDRLVPEEDGRVLMGLDEEMGAALFLPDDDDEDEDGAMAATIYIASADVSGELLRSFLEANYFGEKTAGGVLAINGNALVLTKYFGLYPEDMQEFLQEFAALVGAARYWRKAIQMDALDEAEETKDFIQV